jgi:hypothetical protein
MIFSLKNEFKILGFIRKLIYEKDEEMKRKNVCISTKFERRSEKDCC